MQWDEEPESQETTRTEVKNWKFKRGIIGEAGKAYPGEHKACF